MSLIELYVLRYGRKIVCHLHEIFRPEEIRYCLGGSREKVVHFNV